MAYGMVTTKRRGMFEMANEGTVIDFTTGIEYPFQRPDGEDPTRAWNVEKHDIISFTIINGKATDVKLYKKHVEGTVYYKKL